MNNLNNKRTISNENAELSGRAIVPTNTAKAHCQSKNSENFHSKKDGGLVMISQQNVVRKFRNSDHNIDQLLIPENESNSSRTSGMRKIVNKKKLNLINLKIKSNIVVSKIVGTIGSIRRTMSSYFNLNRKSLFT